ncbi:nitrogen regulation protein NR(II) [Candidatus Neomarinimicrobiota bacterium]
MLTPAKRSGLARYSPINEVSWNRKKRANLKEPPKILEAELEKLKQELHALQGQFQNIIEKNADGIIIVDQVGMVRFINPAATALLGRRPEELVGEMFGFPVMAGESTELDLTLREGKAAIVEMRVMETEWEGENAFMVSMRDITKRKRMEVELLRVHKMEAVGQLATGIAHEINTPLQYIGNNLRFIEDTGNRLINLLKSHAPPMKTTNDESTHLENAAVVEPRLNEKEFNYLADEIPLAIQESLLGLEKISEIIRAMRSFAQPSLLEKTPIDINKAIKDTAAVTRNEWKYVARMELDLAPDLPLIPSLPGEINQVILTLIVNAAQAIKKVVGNCETQDKGTITISTCLDGDAAEIRMRDTGSGIQEEMKSRIFEPFITLKGVGEGTGYGLAIAYSIIVNRLAGTITFNTEEGIGTTFTIRLPVESPFKMGTA